MPQSTIARLQFIGTIFFTAAVLLQTVDTQCLAQQDAASRPVELGIIVTSTEAEASDILRQLNAGWDFSVLAKIHSIDPTSNNGGYFGKLSPSQLRPELRDALAGHTTGQISGIVPVPSGFAITKIFSVAPATADLNSDRIKALIASGDIRFGASLGGLVEAGTQNPKDGHVISVRVVACGLSRPILRSRRLSNSQTPQNRMPLALTALTMF